MVTSQLACFQLIAIIASIVGSSTGSDQIIPCRIPNEPDEGSCVEPETCPAFQEINHIELMGNASRFSFIRELECEIDQQVGICCPRSGKSYQQPWMSMEVKSRERFDIKPRTLGDSGGEEIDNMCGLQFIENRIIQGKFALIDEFPWAALLIYKVNTSRCGGVLISRNFVLTAAHCLTGKDYNDNGPLEFVRLREYNLQGEPDCVVDYSKLTKDCIDEGKIDKPPLSILPHPGYNENYEPHLHDIGLIKIDLTEKYDDFLRPVCLPEAGRLTGLERGKFLTVCGWGQTNLYKEKHKYVSSPIKLKAFLQYVDPSQCRKIYSRYQLASGHICAGGLRKDSCPGDSGSPLMFYDRNEGIWVLSGIVSTGPKNCGTIGKPGIYSSVVEYLPWIKTLTGL